jgi:hypothetical protein
MDDQPAGRNLSYLPIVNPWPPNRGLIPEILVCSALIHGAVRFSQREGRDLDIKLLLTLMEHLVGAVH